ncbi:unnamed protein product [Ilex paraguariensis]|uniref:Uncharacterized protein n=1 Tax=Ilex paraguariensis TaxID=185542 RepID=A0ABC8SZ48_9AQUA
MNFLARALKAKCSLFTHSSQRRLLIPHPVAILHHSSLYATKTPKSRKPTTLEPQQSSSSSLESTEWPRPSEIPWQSKVVNTVNLIGNVKIPVQFQASPDGKYWAGTVIAQNDSVSSDFPSFWIPVIFEGDLAHIAACHLKEKDRVYIAGHLSADPPPFTLSQGQANAQPEEDCGLGLELVGAGQEISGRRTPRGCVRDGA